MTTAKAFVSHLVERAVLPDTAAQRIAAAMDATGHPLDTVIIELGLMREDAFAKEVARFLGVNFVQTPSDGLAPELCAVLGLGFLSDAAVLPLTGPDTQLNIAVCDPFDGSAIEMIEYHFERPATICIGVRSSIVAALTTLKQRLENENSAGGDEMSVATDGDLERLRDFAQQAPIIRFVARVAQAAFDEGATDIHFEPFEHSLRVRIRVDGDLRVLETVSSDLLPGIATRIKILAGLDISERRLPQDGRMRIAVRGQDIDMRVSIVPTIHGETIVLRILDRSTVALDLPTLGFDPAACETLERLASAPNGIFLITGPTGSGKTTTLYALIAILNKPDLKIFTVEDPVEYRMSGVTQLQTNVATGLTFARALRSVLRQDPDIILVGEIRDRETAEIAMQAALTGHLVLSTLHTNSAAGAVTRLRDMGIDNYLIGATVNGVLGQRLLRRCCGCGGQPDCSRCGGTGFRGRTVAYEIMEVSPQIASLISAGDPEKALQGEAAMQGMTPMERQASGLVDSGVTTLSELARAVNLESKHGS